MNTETNRDAESKRDPDKPCIPGPDAQVFPPGEVSLVVAGAAAGLALGFALGALFGARIKA